MRKIMALALACVLVALAVAPATAFGADQARTQLKLKDGSCATCPCL
ncbi:MAG: hypothetical protein U1E22_10275 [Coriobacteriia bacterium]|nr:hypothetical protein [Coriobacteriia bacterium]